MKKLLWWVGGIFIVLIGLNSLGNHPQPAPTTSIQDSSSKTQATTAVDIQGIPLATPTLSTATPVVVVSTLTPAPTATATLSNDNYYTNSDNNSVHAPAYSHTVPAGASAQCRDGTYSFSQHRSGTCSKHGGVSTWL